MIDSYQYMTEVACQEKAIFKHGEIEDQTEDSNKKQGWIGTNPDYRICYECGDRIYQLVGLQKYCRSCLSIINAMKAEKYKGELE